MNSRPFLKITLGALVVAAMSVSQLVAGQSEAREQVAYLGEATTQIAQQETPPASPTPPQPAEAEKKGPGWAVNCKSGASEEGLECRLSQTVVTQQGGQVLADVTFRVPADKKGPEAIVRLPLGVFLPAGATLQVDDKTAQKLNFRACDRNGCYAQAAISSEMLKDLQEGQELKVSFNNLAEKQIDVPLSLDGFPDAYRKIF